MRTLFRLLLAGSMFLAFTVATVSLWRLGLTDPSAWAAVAAALAVIAAVGSAWTSQRVLELQEDAQEPNPVPVIDLRSRYLLAQFRITNHGGASAHDVKITWQEQLRDANGKEVLLARDIAIPVIPERESASVLLGSSHNFFQAHQDTTCRGTVHYANTSGRRYAKEFVVSAEHERVSLVHDEEFPKTLWELQKIPEELKRVAGGLGRLEDVLERSTLPPTPMNGDDKPCAENGSVSDAELNKLMFQAYLLGQQILYKSTDMPKISAAEDKTFDLLRDIADGESTLVQDAEEMLRNTPIASHQREAMKEYLIRTAPKVIDHQRDMARRILEGANFERNSSE